MIVLNYTKLFSIEIQHDYYKDRDPEDILRDISIMPDEATLQIMNGYRLQYKIVQNRLLCFVQTIAMIDSSGGSIKVNIVNKPLVGFNENTVLTFRIVINSSKFFDTSNLRQFYSKNKILKFGNDTGNKSGALFSLSGKIPPYKTSEIYEPGMLTIDTSDQLFEATKESGPGNLQNTTKTQYWGHITNFEPFVNQADLIDDTSYEKCFALISVSFKKNLPGKFSLLKKSSVVAEDNTILGKDYLIHFKNNEVN